MHGIVYRGTSPFMDSLKKKRLPITGGKISENFISVRDVPEKRTETRQEDYPTFAKVHSRCRVVFLRSFISALFVYLFQVHLYLQVCRNFCLVSVLFGGF